MQDKAFFEDNYGETGNPEPEDDYASGDCGHTWVRLAALRQSLFSAHRALFWCERCGALKMENDGRLPNEVKFPTRYFIDGQQQEEATT